MPGAGGNLVTEHPQAQRTLVVAHSSPWPLTSGGRLRLASVIDAFAALGPVDVVALTSEDPEAPSTVSRLMRAPRPRPAGGTRHRLAWLAPGRRPLELHRLKRTGPARAAVRELVRAQPYDLVWYSLPLAYEPVRDIDAGSVTVLDCHDLEHFKHAARSNSARVTTARERAARLQRSVNQKAWLRYYREAAASLSAISVCSALDRQRLGLPGVVVVPNVYPRPAARVRRRLTRTPTLLFAGTMTYGPNLDGASWLVERVMPALWAVRPDARVVIAGQADDRVRRYAQDPRIEVTGFVVDMEEQLARADVVVVPIRYGSGTRLKILEAWSHALPVVSTTLGAEGLGAIDGEHLLLGDNAAAFAAQVRRLLDDPREGEQLGAAGAEHYERHYSPSTVTGRLATLREDILAGVADSSA